MIDRIYAECVTALKNNKRYSAIKCKGRVGYENCYPYKAVAIRDNNWGCSELAFYPNGELVRVHHVVKGDYDIKIESIKFEIQEYIG